MDFTPGKQVQKPLVFLPKEFARMRRSDRRPPNSPARSAPLLLISTQTPAFACAGAPSPRCLSRFCLLADGYTARSLPRSLGHSAFCSAGSILLITPSATASLPHEGRSTSLQNKLITLTFEQIHAICYFYGSSLSLSLSPQQAGRTLCTCFI